MKNRIDFGPNKEVFQAFTLGDPAATDRLFLQYRTMGPAKQWRVLKLFHSLRPPAIALRVIFIILLSSLIFGLPSLFAGDEEPETLTRIKEIEQSLKQLAASQDKLNEGYSEMKDELANLRVWINKR
jgi:hypothetical protein